MLFALDSRGLDHVVYADFVDCLHYCADFTRKRVNITLMCRVCAYHMCDLNQFTVCI